MANFYTNDGEKLLLEVLFRGGTLPGTYQIGLTNAVLTDTSVLADAAAAEPAGNGYARVTMEQSNVGYPTSALDSGHWQISGKNVVFSASGGDITPFQNAFLTDGSILIAVWSTLANSITDGNSFTFVPKLKQTSL